MDLGSCDGVISYGVFDFSAGGVNPALAAIARPGADIDIDLGGDLTMFTSRINSRAGGDISVYAGGKMDLGLQAVGNTDPTAGNGAYGIYTADRSDVSVIAGGDININGSRIAAFSGGNILVESLKGNVDVGNSGNNFYQVYKQTYNPVTGAFGDPPIGLFGSGIVATSLLSKDRNPTETDLPGNITVLAPQGDITSDKAGILQEAIGEALKPGPTITLIAGTPPSGDSPGYKGNIDLGKTGIVGGSITLQAQGDIKGLIVSEQSANINAAQNFTGTLLSAGTANVSAGGSVSGNVIAVTSASVSGGSITANIQSQSASVGGAAAASTFGNSTASAASQSAAQQASSDTRQQLAQNNPQDDDEKKKKSKGAVLTRRVGRVTVFLPKS
jgi:hypothetical protein